jgi:glycosyltransferase involved in cell wall biosynthesis
MRGLMMPDISVIVPIYDIPEAILKNCIDSLISQTFEDIEIILVDDGDKNDCGKICDEYAKRDPRIVVIHQENQGVSTARNAGIDISKAPYIAFVDADDWVDEIMLETAIKVARNGDPDIVLWEYSVEKENAVRSEILEGEVGEDLVAIYGEQKDIEKIQRAMIGGMVQARNGMHGGPVCKLYKRTILLNNNIRFKSGLKRSQDNEFNFRYFEYVSKAIYIEKEFYHYRQISSSATHKYREGSREFLELYLDEVKSNLDKYKKPKVFYDDFDYIVIGKFFDICKTEYAHPSNPQPLRIKINKIKALIKSEPYDSAFKKYNGNEFNKLLKIIVPLAKRKNYTMVYAICILRYFLIKIKYMG